tara:strand:- start:498 stop:1610 length:1113 start_codon:yes stop_codon:yes gene_type:complete
MSKNHFKIEEFVDEIFDHHGKLLSLNEKRSENIKNNFLINHGLPILAMEVEKIHYFCQQKKYSIEQLENYFQRSSKSIEFILDKINSIGLENTLKYYEEKYKKGLNRHKESKLLNKVHIPQHLRNAIKKSIKSLKLISNTDCDARLNFAKKLYDIHPKFDPEESLYLDFEGGWSVERILSLYWPRNDKNDRFKFLWRGYRGDNNLSKKNLLKLLGDLRAFDTIKFIVVFSPGGDLPDERNRFEDFFGSGVFSDRIEWVNMHYILRNSRYTRELIRKNAWAIHNKNKKLIRNSLENLENVFNITRKPEIRSHSNTYADERKGLMAVLNEENKNFKSGLDILENKNLIDYCRQDVVSMYKILKWSSENIKYF